MKSSGPVRAIGIGLLLVGAALGGSTVLGSVGASSAQDASASLVTIDDTVRAHASSGVEIRGETSLDPGSEVTVIGKSTEQGNSFLKATTVTVQDGGEFAAKMDFSGISTGTEFEAIVSTSDNVTTEVDEPLVDEDTILVESDGKIVSEDTQLYPTESTTSDGGDSSSGAFSPGFGPLAAVLAVGGAALLAGRRT